MKAVYQTVDIVYGFSPIIFQTMTFCPLLPANLRKEWNSSSPPIRITKFNDTHVTWYPDGKVVEVQADGTTMTWHPCPQLDKAITMKAGAVYTQFGDNYIIAKYGDKSYYWTSIPNIVATEGKIQKGLKSLSGNWMFYDIEDELYVKEMSEWHLTYQTTNVS